MYSDPPPPLAQANPNYPSPVFGPRNDQPYHAPYPPQNQYPQQSAMPPPAYSSSYYPTNQNQAPLSVAPQQQLSSSIRAYASDFHFDRPPLVSPPSPPPDLRQSLVPQSLAKPALTHPSLLQNQHVTVCISGNVWVIGVIVGALEFCHKLMGCMYRVEYVSPQTGKTVRGEFPPSHLRPA
ncbi:hypothetical protein OF83DRAFT_1175376 [Amylostereum chailletii]|nr:hypothetical protein OF83DRAFT_1175376 [Amylostereum chailletii]